MTFASCQASSQMLLAYIPSPPRGVWHLGPLPIRAYAFFIITGIVIALMIGDRRWAARGGERGVIYDIALWMVPFGLVGGRLYHLATDWQTYWGPGGAGFGAAVRIWDGGLGIWGAVALGVVGAWIGCKRHRVPLPAFLDAVAPAVVLAQAIGRLGNYFNQELYGRETTMPWGLEIFYRRDPAGFIDVHSLDGISTGVVHSVVQPTFLYELLWNLLVFGALIYLDRRFTFGHGRLFGAYVALYCVGRFGVELLRDDTATHIAGIRINTFTSTFVFIGAVVYIMLAPKGRETPSALDGHVDGGAEVEPNEEPAAEAETVAAAVPEVKPAKSKAGKKGKTGKSKVKLDKPAVAETTAGEQEPEVAETAAVAEDVEAVEALEDTQVEDTEAEDIQAEDTEAEDTEAETPETEDVAAAATEAAATEAELVESELDEPVADEPVADEPVADEPVADEPMADEPVADEPMADEPVADEPEPASETTEAEQESDVAETDAEEVPAEEPELATEITDPDQEADQETEVAEAEAAVAEAEESEPELAATTDPAVDAAAEEAEVAEVEEPEAEPLDEAAEAEDADVPEPEALEPEEQALVGEAEPEAEPPGATETSVGPGNPLLDLLGGSAGKAESEGAEPEEAEEPAAEAEADEPAAEESVESEDADEAGEPAADEATEAQADAEEAEPAEPGPEPTPGDAEELQPEPSTDASAEQSPADDDEQAPVNAEEPQPESGGADKQRWRFRLRRQRS